MWNFIKRMFNTIVPLFTRAQGGTFVTMVPTGAGIVQAAPLKLTAGTAATWGYGAVATAISATANTTECWIEGVMISNATSAAKQYFVAITTATAITAAAQILGEVPGDLALTTSMNLVALGQRIRIPPNVAIGLALAASVKGKSADVQLVISRQK